MAYLWQVSHSTLGAVSSLSTFKAPFFCPAGETPQYLPYLFFLGTLTCPGVPLPTALSHAPEPPSSLRGI